MKDLGRTLGLFVVVTNCTDQQKYTDCAKIFKGLCQARVFFVIVVCMGIVGAALAHAQSLHTIHTHA